MVPDPFEHLERQLRGLPAGDLPGDDQRLQTQIGLERLGPAAGDDERPDERRILNRLYVPGLFTVHRGNACRGSAMSVGARRSPARSASTAIS